MAANLHDFLVEHAKFPFPVPNELRSAGATDISQFEVSMLDREWKANHAVRDDDIFQNLCNTLRDVLGDTPFTGDFQTYLPPSFSPILQFNQFREVNPIWLTNEGESEVGASTNSSFLLVWLLGCSS